MANELVSVENCEIHSQWEYNATGKPLKVRRNGKTKRWKRNPEKFKIPIKYGLNTYGYITNYDCGNWRVIV